MVFEALFSLMTTIAKIILYPFNLLPPMPALITDAGDLVSNYAVTGASFMFEIVGKPLGLAIFAIVTLYLVFTLTYFLITYIWFLIKL